MSLNRIAVRTAMVAACNNFGVEPWPTLAGPMIYDSKIEPVENASEDVAYPMAVIYTDYDRNGIAHAGIAPGDRTMTITIELLVGIIKRSDEVDGYAINTPVTDSELESSLDIFEYQVFEALRADNSAANCFRTICYGVDQVVSRRGASTEGGTKIAARQLTLECRALIEPITPVLTPYMDRFLTDLEESEGFSLVAKQLRVMYEGNASITELQRIRRTMGWSDDTFGVLGYPAPGAPVTPPAITWLDAAGNPL